VARIDRVTTAEELNRELIAGLKAHGCLRSARIEAAFESVPRHLFLPGLPLDEAYADEAITTKRIDSIAVSSSSQPAIMAEMLEQLQPLPGQSVLEIGAGSGYNAALMSRLVGPRGSVVSVDIDPDLVAGAASHLRAAGCGNVEVVRGDGGFGHPRRSPYDRIIVTAASTDIPQAWREQLKPGGRLVLPLVLAGGAEASVAFVQKAGWLESASLVPCGFMPLRGAFASVPRRQTLGEGVSLFGDQPDLVAKEVVQGWLAASGSRLELDLEAPLDALSNRFRPWLALNDPNHVVLVQESSADREAKRYGYFCGVLLPAGLALLTPTDDGKASIRWFGPVQDAAQRLRDRLRQWDASGRPGLEEVSIRSYPRGQAPAPPPPGTRTVNRPSTTLLLSMRRM
jgi:protein-L-isoaspartate(D-aspartate) O-methyltransferase